MNGIERGKIARLHPDGSIDTSFNPGAKNPDPGDVSEVSTISLQGNRILVGGRLSHLAGQPASALVRLNPDGTRDATFNPPAFSYFSHPSVQVAIDRGDGKIFVAGAFTSVGGQARNHLVMLDSDGSIDPSFNPAVNNVVMAALPVSGDRWIIGGEFTTVSGQARQGITRILADGSMDPTFAAVPLPSGATIFSLFLQPDGKILYAGRGNSGFVGRALPDGGADPEFTPSADPAYLQKAVALPNGDVVINGPEMIIDGSSAFGLTRFQPNGSTGTIPPVLGLGKPWALHASSDGSVIVGGEFPIFGDHPRYSLARILPGGSVDPGFHPDATQPSKVRSILPLSGGRWIVAGEFTGARGGNIRPLHAGVSRLAPDLGLDPGFTQMTSSAFGTIGAAAEDPEGKLLIGGASRLPNGATAGRLTRIHADGGVDPTFTVTFASGNTLADIAVQPDGKILAAGTLTRVNDTLQKNIVRLTPGGSLDTSFVPPTIPAIHDIALENGGRIFAGGNASVRRLQFSGALDPNFNQSLPLVGNINKVVALSGRRVIIAGDFTSLNGQPAGRIARLDSLGNPDPTFQPGSGSNGIIRSVQVRSDGDLFIAGDFTSFNGQPRRGIAQLSPDGDLRSVFDPGDGFNGSVNSLALTPDGHVLAGGAFTRAGNLQRAGFAKLFAAPLQSTLPPSVPGNLAATPISSKEVLLVWTDSGGESAYVVERRETGTVDWQIAGRPPSDATFLKDDTVVPGKTYEYRLVAWNPAGDSALAVGASATVPTRAGQAGAPATATSLDLWNHGEVRAATRQADGKVIIAGRFTHFNGMACPGMARLTVAGALDPSFVPDPALASIFNVEVMAVQSTGRIIVGGGGGIVGLTSAGSIDPTFTPPSSLSLVSSLAVLSDDRLMVGGAFSGGSRPYLARTTANGVIDTSFANAGLNGEVDAIVVLPDGKLLVSGSFTRAGFGFTTSVARLHGDGSRDTSFAAVMFKPPAGSVGNALGTTMALQSDGKIIVGGRFASVNNVPRNSLVRLEPTGAVDSTFVSGTSPNDFLHYVGLLPDGKVTIGGQFQSYAGSARSCWAVLSPTGTLDPGDAGIRSGYVRTGLPLPDGRILVVGEFCAAGAAPHFGLVRLEANAATVDGTFNSQVARPGTVHAITRQPDGKALVLGDFASVGGPPLSGLFRPTLFRINQDGSIDHQFDAGTGFNIRPRVVATGSDGRVFAGGDFQSVAGVLRSRIAALHPHGAVDMSFNPGSGADNTIHTLVAEADGDVTVGGSFTTVGGAPRTRLARLDQNGSVTSEFSGLAGPNNLVLSSLHGANGALWIGGQFTTIHGSSAPYLARLQESGAWDPAATPVLDGQVSALISQPDRPFFAGGNFSAVSGVPRARVARLTANGGVDAGFVPQLASTAAFPSTFTAFALDEADRLYIAGTWRGSVLNRTLHILRLSPDGSLDPSFDTGISGSNVNALGVINSGLLAGGTFTEWDGQPRYGLVQLRTTPSLGTPVAPESASALGQEGGAALFWNEVAGASGYLIEKAGVSSSTWIPVATVPAGNPAYTDLASPGSHWRYRVSAFNAAGPSSSTAPIEVIIPTTYSQWRSDLGIPTTTTDGDDSDHDGIPLLLEYSLALSPSSSDRHRLPTIETAGGNIRFSYIQARPDIDYLVEASTDLVHWSSEGVSQGMETLRRVASIPKGGNAELFLRLRVRTSSP